jgi:type II secretory pathway pseudopilin PulG
MTLKWQSGFTLIEALAAGLISTIVAGALLTVLSMTNAQIRDGAIRLKTGQMHTVVSDQLRTSAYNAYGVKAAGEDLTDPLTLPVYAGGVANTQTIIFCNKAGIPFARYNINTVSNYLEEWLEAIPLVRPAGYYPFKVGVDTAFLNGAASSFTLDPGRIGFSLNLLFTSPYSTYTFPNIIEAIRCRNPN